MATCPTCRTTFPDGVTVCPIDAETLLPDAAFASVDVGLVAGFRVGEYVVEGLLGEGGFGAVYAAVHPLIGKRAAVKVLNRQFSSNPQMVSRFIAEARAVNQIRHRNIIDIFSFGTLEDGRHYYVMELLDGMPMDKLLEQRGRLALPEAMPILRGIARALDAAHAAGLAHRDLKPENVFLVPGDEGAYIPKLLDFGIAKLLSDETTTHKTKTGTPIGTPMFMSPEQCRGVAVDHRTDVYSFGVLCHRVLTGGLPINGETMMDLLMAHIAAPPARMTEHAPDLPEALDAPVLRMLAKDPANRPSSVGAALDDLARAAAASGADVGPALGSASALPPIGSTTRVTASGPAPAAARTATQPGDSARTLTPQETQVAPPGRGRAIAIGIAVLAAGLGAAGAFALRGGGAAPAVGAAAGPAVPSTSASIAATATPIANDPVDVVVTLNSNAPRTEVFLDGKKVGDAPGPLTVPFGHAKVTLTVRAPGFSPSSVELVPESAQQVTVTLARVAAPKATARTNKDLENPF